MSDTYFEFSSVITPSEAMASAAASHGLVIVVTGANRGIGYKTVHRLAEILATSELSTVLLTSRTKKQAEMAVTALSDDLKAGGVHSKLNIVPEVLDISDDESIHALKDRIEEGFHGRLDILINNAGMAFTMADTTPFADQAKITINVNYYGTKKVIVAMLPLLRHSVVSDGGRVVNVSSMSGILTGSSVASDIQKKLLSTEATLSDIDAVMDGFVAAARDNIHKERGYWNSAYGASKSGVTQLTRVLALRESMTCQDNPKNKEGKVLFYSCCPGLCRTDMTVRNWTSFVSIAFWAVTWLVGHSAYAGADTPSWLAVGSVSNKYNGIDDDKNGHFFSAREVGKF